MWKITLCCNIFILSLFWLLSQVAITPAHSLLVQYAKTGAALPVLTGAAIQFRSPSAAIPIIWAILTIFMGVFLKNKNETKRNEWLSFHTSLTGCIGLLLFFFYSLAGILPLLKISAIIS